MSNYTKTTNFTAKDSLPSGNANKKINGSLFDTEFDALATAVNSKSNTATPSFTGVVTSAGNVVVDDTTDSTSGTTGSIQTDGGIGAVKDVVTDATFKPLGDTAASDAAAVGYTAIEGLILTGQGSTNDVTIKNDADAEVMGVLTGTTTADFKGAVNIAGVTTVGGNILSDTDSTDDLGSTGIRWANLWVDDITVTTSVTAGGDITGLTLKATGDTSAGDSAAMGYTATEGLILTGQGSTNDITLKNDADAEVMSVPTGTTTATFAGDVTVQGAFTSLGIDDNASATAITIDSSGNVGIGTSSPSSYYADKLVVQGSFDGDGITIVSTGTTTDSYFAFADGTTGDERYRGAIGYYHGSDALVLYSAGTERMRIDSSGNVGIGNTNPAAKLNVTGAGRFDNSAGTPVRLHINNSGSNDYASIYADTSGAYKNLVLNPNGGNVLVGKTSTSFTTAGSALYSTGQQDLVVNADNVLSINRLTNDGSLVNFYQATTLEGSISVSGTTVSYNGGHLARWTQVDSDNDGLLKGTVMTNLDDMCVWKQAVFTTQELVTPAVEAVAEIPEEWDEEGNIIEEYVPAVEAQDAVYQDVEQRETYEGDAADGDIIDFEYEGQTYSATVVVEDNEQLNKMEVSSIEGDANVAGVFVAYDDDGDIGIAMTGDMVIRIAQGTTVARGDLLMSAGDGTAKPQGDDIVRSKTIAKVTSTNVSHTYDDGSYLVPCVLMAC